MMTISIKKQFKAVPNLNRELLLNRYISYLNLVRSGFTPVQARLQVFKQDENMFRLARKSYLDI